jgi:hypothetical protein
MKTIVKEVKINLEAPTSYVEIFKNGDWLNVSNEEIIGAFHLEQFHYATILDNVKGKFKSFNTYNDNSPLTVCGAFNEDLDFAILNLHNGGDPRGNYSSPYYSDDSDCIMMLLNQTTHMIIKTISEDGEEKNYFIECDNAEAYFNLDTIDVYDLECGAELKPDQLEELQKYY